MRVPYLRQTAVQPWAIHASRSVHHDLQVVEIRTPSDREQTEPSDALSTVLPRDWLDADLTDLIQEQAGCSANIIILYAHVAHTVVQAGLLGFRLYPPVSTIRRRAAPPTALRPQKAPRFSSRPLPRRWRRYIWILGVKTARSPRIYNSQDCGLLRAPEA